MIYDLRIIHIAWEKFDFSDETIKKLDKEYDYGIYQIYGNHPVYGENVLLYIGKANDQTFASRLNPNQRIEFSETIIQPKYLHIGRLLQSEDCNLSNWEKMIDISEKILIKAHCPAYNSSEIKGLYSEENIQNNKEHYIIKNWYQYGRLLPEVSSMNVTYKYWREFDKRETYIGKQ